MSQRPSPRTADQGYDHGAVTSRGPVREPFEVMLPVRDGVRLATDVYTAGPEQGPRPVVLERTPYGKRTARDSDQSRRGVPVVQPHESSAFFLERGYTVVRQDCRGRGQSEGEFVKYLNEGPDGADTLAWIAAQPWCDGRVLMNGVSYSAHAQTAAAAEAPPALAAMFLDSGGFSSAYEAGMRMGGAFELKQATWAFRHAVRSKEASENPVLAAGLAETDVADWFHMTPWRAGNSPLSLLPGYEDYLLEQWANENFGPFWTQPAIYARGSYDRFPDVPSFHISSWYDPYVLSAIENFTELGRRKQSPSRLLLGPWTHGKRCLTFAGDVDFGPQAAFDENLAPSYLNFRADWFDAVVDGTADSGPRVTYFVMGGGPGTRNDDGRLEHGGTWEHAGTWPPENTQRVPFFLSPGGGLQARPAADDAALTYSFDPADPVPTIGGQVTSGEPVMRGGAFDQMTGPHVFGAREPYLPLCARPDVLVFRTPELSEPVTVAGGVEVELYVSSSAPDTDFTVKLIDEHPPSEDYPRGFAMNLTEGILRARFRDSFSAPEPMEPGEVYRLTITAPDTANIFAAGHRIRLDVSSSNFPRFDVNPNTGGVVATTRTRRVAENTVHMSPQHPSAVVLSVANRPS